MSRTLLVGWGSYFSIKPGEIKKLNVVVRPGQEPPEQVARWGVQCQRVGMNVDRRYVVYAGSNALDDIRTLVELVQQMETGNVNAEAEAGTE